MNLYEPIGENSIIDEINRLCNTTNEVYANKEKVARINDALDKYWFLAVNSASKMSFDDTGQTSLPVEKQNLVSGTNYYQLSGFTNNVLQIVRISVLDDDADERDLIREDFDDINEFYERYHATDNTGAPTHWTKMGDFIYIYPTPDYNETDGLRCYLNRELSKFTWTAFTVTEANPGVATDTAHGLEDSDLILLITDGALPDGLTADTTAYYADQQDADTWQFCTTPSDVGSSYVDTSGGGSSGTHQWLKVNQAPGIPVIHHNYLANWAALKFIDDKHPNFKKIFRQVKEDEEAIRDYWRTMEGESNAIIKTAKRLYK